MVKYTFSNIIERDCDFAIIKSFLNNKKVQNLFLNKIHRKAENIESAYHSLMDQEEGNGMGESDIVFIINDEKGKYGLFIEDKVNADPQPEQRERYDIRAKQMQNKGCFDKFEVFLCAPKQYLVSSKAEGYDLTVSYEDIIEALDDGIDKAILLKACECKTVLVKDENITNYWYRLYAYVSSLKNTYIDISGRPSDKSVRSLWPSFRTKMKGCYIVLKTDRGYLDLEFGGMGDKREVVDEALKKIGINENTVKTGKSASLRKVFDEKDYLYFSKDFDNQIEILKKWLDVVETYTKITERLKAEHLLDNK